MEVFEWHRGDSSWFQFPRIQGESRVRSPRPPGKPAEVQTELWPPDKVVPGESLGGGLTGVLLLLSHAAVEERRLPCLD